MSAVIQHKTGPSARSQGAGIKPEWITVPNATRIFGIGRSRLYELLAQGRIKTASIRGEGKAKGRRLISYDSLAAYVESFAEGPRQG